MILNALLWGLLLYMVPGIFYTSKLFADKGGKQVIEDARPNGPVYLFVLWLVTVLAWFPFVLCSVWSYGQSWRKHRARLAELDAYGAKFRLLSAAINNLNLSVENFKRAVESGDEAKKKPALEALLSARLCFAEQLCGMADHRCADCGGIVTGILFRMEPAVLCRICGRLFSYDDIQKVIDGKIAKWKELVK